MTQPRSTPINAQTGSTAAPVARNTPHMLPWQGTRGHQEIEAMKERIITTPRLQEACHLAQDALMLAIQSVDDVLDDNDCALDHPELVVAFMTFAAGAYRSAEETPAIH